MTLLERLQTEKERSLDRRRISEHSRRKIAEALHHDNPQDALESIFEVVTGESIATYPPVRDIQGEFSLGSDVSLTENQYLLVEVTIGDKTQRQYVDATSDTYTFSEYEDGTYSVAVQVTELREYDPDTLDMTRYNITNATTTLSADTVTVDTIAVAIGTDIQGPTVTVDSITVGDKITGGMND